MKEQTNMDKNKGFIRFVAGAIVAACLSGCSNDVLDPTQIGRFRPVPVVNVILDSLGVADEPQGTYAGAEDPRPQDVIEYEQNYVFGTGDVIRISIYELYREAQGFTNDYRVSESGHISIPDVGQVRAAGLTEVQLEQEIRNILSPTILKSPSVNVLLMQSEGRVFSIVGQGVPRPSRYPIPRYTFRLTDAIAQAGGIGEFNVSYIYISRDEPAEQAGTGGLTSGANTTPVKPEQIELAQLEPEKPAAPATQAPATQTTATGPDKTTAVKVLETAKTEPATHGQTDPKNNRLTKASEEEVMDVMNPSDRSDRQETAEKTPVASAPEDTGQAAEKKIDPQQTESAADARELQKPQAPPAKIEWVFEDGRWKPIQTASPKQQAVVQPSMEPGANILPEGNYDWKTSSEIAKRTRVIRIPVDKLLGGDPRYDILIRPGDRVSVPLDIIGEFCINGNVNIRGYIDLTGRKMTLKQAISAAGGLNTLAWPKKIEVVRRIGRNKAGLMQEETVLVDLDKIAKGLQPDFFIKRDDWINVGTHGISRYLAVLRNAFRAEYGFDFIYSRNFADRDYLGDPWPF